MPEENKSGISFGKEYDSNGEFELIDDGDYEVIIEKIEPRTAKSGRRMLNFTFRIREDVDQKFQRRKLFYAVMAKEGDKCYDFPRINKMIITQPNFKTYFLEFDEVIQYLIGLHMKLTVETNFDEYSGKDRNEVKDWSFAPSEWDKTHPDERKVLADGITDDDLPF